MKKLASYGVVALFVFAALGVGAPASAAGPTVSITVDRDEVRSGRIFTVTASANVRCQWLVQWNGQRRVGHGKRFTGSFTAPSVTRPQRLPVTATCFHTTSRGDPVAAPGGSAERIAVDVPARTLRRVVITVLPPRGTVAPPQPQEPGAPTPGGLPNTGGPLWWLLLGGTATLVAGVVTVRRTTRRVED